MAFPLAQAVNLNDETVALREVFGKGVTLVTLGQRQVAEVSPSGQEGLACFCGPAWLNYEQDRMSAASHQSRLRLSPTHTHPLHIPAHGESLPQHLLPSDAGQACSILAEGAPQVATN